MSIFSSAKFHKKFLIENEKLAHVRKRRPQGHRFRIILCRDAPNAGDTGKTIPAKGRAVVRPAADTAALRDERKHSALQCRSLIG
jgi:hypothetical protein